MQEAACKAGLADAATPLEFDLLTMVQQDWQQQDQLEDRPASYSQATLQHIDRAKSLLDTLLSQHGMPQLVAVAEELSRLKARACAARPVLE